MIELFKCKKGIFVRNYRTASFFCIDYFPDVNDKHCVFFYHCNDIDELNYAYNYLKTKYNETLEPITI